MIIHVNLMIIHVNSVIIHVNLMIIHVNAMIIHVNLMIIHVNSMIIHVNSMIIHVNSMIIHVNLIYEFVISDEKEVVVGWPIIYQCVILLLHVPLILLPCEYVTTLWICYYLVNMLLPCEYVTTLWICYLVNMLPCEYVTTLWISLLCYKTSNVVFLFQNYNDFEFYDHHHQNCSWERERIHMRLI
jgi:hypothetical protein